MMASPLIMIQMVLLVFVIISAPCAFVFRAASVIVTGITPSYGRSFRASMGIVSVTAIIPCFTALAFSAPIDAVTENRLFQAVWVLTGFAAAALVTKYLLTNEKTGTLAYRKACLIVLVFCCMVVAIVLVFAGIVWLNETWFEGRQYACEVRKWTRVIQEGLVSVCLPRPG